MAGKAREKKIDLLFCSNRPSYSTLGMTTNALRMHLMTPTCVINKNTISLHIKGPLISAGS